ncbi:DUF4089 domain-containing protein [Bosea sp. (in: a-proteobacteria)]|jgi:hypothetical protein|uniref:DUF4089 domain-containing protein n=1 Tax=Bosea sp. (in: a-proteobacteria) TaxID=1871050 RepID=UPI002B46E327|nr:DUF4089 domain-containing protein [Bosea sp. (in: a-proteobacteria)]WRH59918.1 MAG: DUF4089 domain-containing protein [Bosea sp. (in: a-proteobacteria)]
MSGADPKTPFDAARHCDAMAPVLGLTITEAQRPVVLQFLAIAHGMAEIVAAAPIDEASLELAPVFRPGVPEVTA